MPALFREFREARPDIVQTYLSGFDYLANVAARRAGVAVVASSRRECATWKKRRHLWLQRRANRNVDAIVANSRAVADFSGTQEREPVESYTVIYNGADVPVAPDRDIRLQLTIPRTAPVIGMVANFSEDKDHALFVAMAERIHKRRPDAHFVLVGDGPLRDATQRAAVRARLGDAFRFTGARADAASLNYTFDVAVLTSKTEGLPNAILEAMAAGRPVVAAAVGGVPEIVDDATTGRLMASRNADEFADAVLQLLENPTVSARMGERAAEHVREKFGVEAMVSAHRDLYLGLMAARRGAG
jgi:glycosyltransferase involved in cell wall biosynthesis